jgi:hypothetical protein
MYGEELNKSKGEQLHSTAQLRLSGQQCPSAKARHQLTNGTTSYHQTLELKIWF